VDIEVDCHAGYRGEETPRRLRLGRRSVVVVRVLDRWLSPDHRYFKVYGDDQGVYIVRHDTGEDRWEMTFFRQE
jgi:hypothetical protein